jgi:hypothetical protein
LVDVAELRAAELALRIAARQRAGRDRDRAGVAVGDGRSVVVEPSPSPHVDASGSQVGRQTAMVPSFECMHCVPRGQSGSASVPSQNGTHTPWSVVGSTLKQNEVASQSSTPETPEPSTVHGSPGAPPSGSMAVHRLAFQKSPPSFAHGAHFSPGMQSWSITSHSHAERHVTDVVPGGTRNVAPSSLLVLSSVVVDGSGGIVVAVVTDDVDDVVGEVIGPGDVEAPVEPSSPAGSMSIRGPQPTSASPRIVRRSVTDPRTRRRWCHRRGCT